MATTSLPITGRGLSGSVSEPAPAANTWVTTIDFAITEAWALSPGATRVYLTTDSSIKIATLSPPALQAKSDTFSVTVSNGEGGSTTVPVTVLIAPSNT